MRNQRRLPIAQFAQDDHRAERGQKILETNSRDGRTSLTLRDLATPLFRRRRELVTTFLVIFAVVAWFGLLRLHQYEAHMAIRVSRDADPRISTGATRQVGAPLPLTHEELEPELELLKSRDLLEQVVLANGLENAQGFFLSRLGRRQTPSDRVAHAVQALARQIEVEAPARSNVIEVSYRSSDPAQAYGVLNSLSNFYLEKRAGRQLPGASLLFASHGQSYKSALNDAKDGLRAAGSTGAAPVANGERIELAGQLNSAVAQSHAIEQAIAAGERRIQSEQQKPKDAGERPATMQDSQQTKLLLQNLGDSLLKRAQLLQKYGPGHPLVQQADQRIAQAKAAIARGDGSLHLPTSQSSSSNLAKDEADLAGQRASLAANQRGIENIKSQMDEADLQREAKAVEQNYLRYLSQREQERASDRKGMVNVAIATQPAIPALPAHDAPSILLLAFASGSLISVATASLVDFLDPSFQTPAQVIGMLGVPVVVGVPKRTV